jgi:uncharacterized protein YndB with AHSA1/START domain
MATKKPSADIHLIRVYDAPLDAVWSAWTDSAQVAQWWGPRGFTLTTHRRDFRTGGQWVYTMHGPDGVDYSNTTTYLEIQEKKKMVYDHGANENQPPLFRVTALFSEEHGKTRLDLTMTLPSPERAAEIRTFIKKAGGDATWDRLAEHLAEAQNKNIFVINRSFDAPVGLVFDLWTQPEHFSQWLPPTGAEMAFLRSDIRPGGEILYVMTAPNNLKMYGRISYQKIEKPHRLVYTQQFCDEKGGLARHPLAPTWPETMLTVVTFEPEGEDRTRVTVTWEPHGPTTREELDTFLKGRAGMTLGWTGSFDKLENRLASLVLSKA